MGPKLCPKKLPECRSMSYFVLSVSITDKEGIRWKIRNMLQFHLLMS